MKENVWKNLEIKMTIILLLTVLLLSTSIYYIKYIEYNAMSIDQLRKDAINIHKYAETVFDERSFTDLNSIEDEESDVYLSIHQQLDDIRHIANIRYLYTAKETSSGSLIYVVDGLDRNDELFRHVGDPIENEIIPMLKQCLNDEIVFSEHIMDTEWGVVYVTYFPFHDSTGNVIGAIGMEFDCEDLYIAIARVRTITILLSALIAFAFILLAFFTVRKVIKDTEEIFVNMKTALNEASELAMLMLDASPTCIQIWDRNFNTLDCNIAAVKLYGFRDKQEYKDRFLNDCSPEYQPDGRRSVEKAAELVNQAFEEGYCIYDWTHKMPDDNTLIPSIIKLVRAKYRDNDVVLSYTTDMRDHYMMVDNLKQRDRMLQAVNNAAVMLLTTDENEDIEIPLIKSMELVCRSADADRVYIWHKEIVNGELYLVCMHSWFTETGKLNSKLSTGSKISFKDWCMFDDRFRNGNSLSSPVSKLPENEKVFFESYGVKSIAMIPLFLDKQFWGVFSIDDCTQERGFTEEVIAILRSVSLMLASAINRHLLVEKRTHELALQTATFSTLFDSIPDIIFTKDADLRFTHCNKAFLEHFGKNLEDLIGTNNRNCLGLSDEIMELYIEQDRNVLNTRNAVTIEEYAPRVDGKVLLFETTRIPLLLDGEAIGIVCIAHDITKRKEMEAAALAASQAKSSFLANMSHEIRTPMNVIFGVTELLIQHSSLPAEIDEGLGKIYSSCDLLLGIINDILDFSKIEAGKMDIMPHLYKVASMINDSMYLNMMHINSKPIEFELQIDENVPANLIGDELRIKQIMNNLLSNAFKYTDTGKVTLSVISEAIPGTNSVILVLGIRDTGYGLSKDQVERLFEEYSRFNREKFISTQGTGLGLAITQQLVTLMNGEILVESEIGKGSLFTIRLPQETVDSEVLGKEIAANFGKFGMSYLTHRKRGQIARNPMPYGSVLIVDDVETNLYVAIGLMKLYLLHIETAMSGKEAIEKIQSGKVYDIIFMDHMMPEMDGIETTRRLRNLGYKEPIVALTANAVAGQAGIFLENGFNEFISKPIDIRQLNSILNMLIRDKQPLEVLEAARREKAESDGNTKQVPQVETLLHESFIRDAHKTIDWLETYIQSTEEKNENVMRTFVIMVHGIKSSLWNIGETTLSEFALKLENSGRDNDTEQIAASLPEFLGELRSLVEKLEEGREEQETDEVIEDDIEGLLNKLHEIKKMCADYNRRGALDILSEIRECSKETKAVLDGIKDYVLHSDFEEAESAAEAFASGLSTQRRVAYNGSADSAPASLLLNREIDGLDLAEGLERYDGDEKTYLKLLRSYTSSVRTLLDTIKTYSGDALKNYQINIHGIKGTSLDISAGQTGKKAAALEEAAKAGDIDFIAQNNPEFIESTQKLISDIEDMLEKINAENPKPKKEKPDDDTLSRLLTACRNYDINGADKAMAEIDKYQYEGDDGLAEWLREQIDKMDFSRIIQKLTE